MAEENVPANASFDFSGVLGSLTSFFESILAVIRNLMDSIVELVNGARRNREEEKETNA